MSTHSDLIKRTDEEQKRSIEIYNSFRDELLKRQLSNTENYDKSILMLSSAGLAISLTFFKFIVPVKLAENLWLIKLSWGFFLLTVILSLIAYLVSNLAINKQLKIAEDYYVNKKNDAFNKKNKFSIINNWLNYVVGLFFSVAITMVVIFVILNFQNGVIHMSEEKTKVVSVIVKHEKVIIPLIESATIPLMPRVTVEGLGVNSANIPSMQAVPSSSNQVQSPEQQVKPSQSSESKSEN